MYKEASRLKLKVMTNRGLLTVEQLWDLNLSDLADAVKGVNKILKSNDDDDLSFLKTEKVIDVENNLRFNILKDIYQTKNDEANKLKVATENKAYNERILRMIADDEEAEIRGLSKEEKINLLR